jgi:hypothetical protein
MMILPIASAAAGAVTAALALSSGRNMLQTFQISRGYQETTDTKAPWIPPSLHRHLSDPTVSSTTSSVVSDLEDLSRKELVELFLSCQRPENISAIEGEWNGVLLENNGFVLVSSDYTFGRAYESYKFVAMLTAHLTTFCVFRHRYQIF